MIQGRRSPQDRLNILEGLHFPGTQGLLKMFQEELKNDDRKKDLTAHIILFPM